MDLSLYITSSSHHPLTSSSRHQQLSSPAAPIILSPAAQQLTSIHSSSGQAVLVFPCQQLVFLKQQRVVNPSLSSSSSLLILDHSSSSVLIIDQQLITVHPELRQRPNQQRVPLLIFKQQIVID
ncbi:unnamed protein product [Tilletia controversa]|nr:unnamed protein product [Tilletia controversa]